MLDLLKPLVTLCCALQTRIQKERFQDRPQDYEAAKGGRAMTVCLVP